MGPLTLTWNAPVECPAQTDVAAEVDRRLGGSTSGTPVVATATVSRHGDAWQVVLATDQGGALGERTLAGPTCAAVASATALILALTIDPNALAHAPDVPPPPPPEPPPAKPSPATPPPHQKTHVRDTRLFVRAAPAIGFGLMPGASGGAIATFGARAGRFSIETSAAAFFPQSVAAARAGTGGTFYALVSSGAACGAFVSTTSARASACAGFEVEAIHAEGFGVASPRTRMVAIGAPTAAIVVEVAVAAPLWIFARLDAAVPLDHPTFVLAGIGPVYTVESVAGRASFGAAVHF